MSTVEDNMQGQGSSERLNNRNAEEGQIVVIWQQREVGFPGSSAGKESTCNVGYPSSIPGSGRSSGEGIGHSSILGLP